MLTNKSMVKLHTVLYTNFKVLYFDEFFKGWLWRNNFFLRLIGKHLLLRNKFDILTNINIEKILNIKKSLKNNKPQRPRLFISYFNKPVIWNCKGHQSLIWFLSFHLKKLKYES